MEIGMAVDVGCVEAGIREGKSELMVLDKGV